MGKDFIMSIIKAIKITRKINDVRNPKWINEEHTLLDCEVDFDEEDKLYVPFTADPTDIHEWSKIIFDDCVAGKYGEIEEFDVEAFEAQKKADADFFEEAEAKKKASMDKWKALGLTEEDLENLGMN